MHIKITRFFERTRQIADFVPVKAACEITMEMSDEGAPIEELEAEIKVVSHNLDQIVQAEVEKTLMGYVPCCVGCGGKPLFPKKGLTKEGMCDTCNTKLLHEQRQFKADNAKNRGGTQVEIN